MRRLLLGLVLVWGCGGGHAPGTGDGAVEARRDVIQPGDSQGGDPSPPEGGDDAEPGDAPLDVAADSGCASGDGAAAEGAACACGADCASGFCADGVCCDSACTDACLACDLAGQEGTCAPVPAGTADPACADEGAASCGHDGRCDGAGQCRRYPAGTVCTPEACTGSARTARRTCDGLGRCLDAPPPQSCAPYLCGAGGKCATACGSTADCLPPATCVDGSCGGKPVGAPCTDAGQCASGFCVDGHCCESTCTGTCRSCGLPGAEGSCALIPAGLDPDDECTMEAPSTCGWDGTCDGGGGCRFYPPGTVCAPTACGGSMLQGSRQCMGPGICGATVTVDCAPYACAATACRSTCAGDGDCADSAYCVAGKCVSKEGSGAACSADRECSAGHCVDGVCCASACGQPCQACNVAGALGTCSAIKGADDSPECSGPRTCDAAGACKTKNGGSCASPGDCLSGFCQDGVCCATACTGSCQTCAAAPGTCTTVADGGADPDTCAGRCYSSACYKGDCSNGLGHCTANGDCGQCSNTGAACTSGAACGSGTCAATGRSCSGNADCYYCDTSSATNCAGSDGNCPSKDTRCCSISGSGCSISCPKVCDCGPYGCYTCTSDANCSDGSCSSQTCDTCTRSGTCNSDTCTLPTCALGTCNPF